MTQAALAEELVRVVKSFERVDVVDPDGARAWLDRRWPSTSLAAVHDLVRAGASSGWITADLTRVVKARARSFSADVAHWSAESAPRPHTHPSGAIDLVLALDGAPTYDGKAPGWHVHAPASRHTPLVRGGAVVVLSFLPGGRVVYDADPLTPAAPRR